MPLICPLFLKMLLLNLPLNFSAVPLIQMWELWSSCPHLVLLSSPGPHLVLLSSPGAHLSSCPHLVLICPHVFTWCSPGPSVLTWCSPVLLSSPGAHLSSCPHLVLTCPTVLTWCSPVHLAGGGPGGGGRRHPGRHGRQQAGELAGGQEVQRDRLPHPALLPWGQATVPGGLNYWSIFQC